MAPWHTFIREDEDQKVFHSELELLLNTCSSQEVCGIRKLQLLEAKCNFESMLTSVRSPKLIWLHWNASIYSSLPSWIPLCDSRFLEVLGWELKRLWQSRSEAPLHFWELNIEAPLSEFPRSLRLLKHLENIVLNCPRLLTYADLAMLPEEFCYLSSLRYLSLIGCSKLQLLPILFRNLKKLEYFHLSKCNSLEMLPDSFGNLTNLQHINLTDYGSLKMLPNSFGNLVNLQHTNISKCINLEMIPNSFGNLTTLQHINLTLCGSLKMLPDSFQNPRNLQTMNLTLCRSWKMLPTSFENLENLQYINLSRCKCLEMIPSFQGNILQLRHLNLSDCLNLTLSTLGDITTLECLDLLGCLQMELLPSQVGSQPSLKKLNLFYTNIKDLPSTIVCLSNLELLMLGSRLLGVFPYLFRNLSALKELCLHGCPELKCLPDSVCMLSQLTRLKITKCGIQYLPLDLMNMKSLELLKVTRSPLRQLPFKRVKGEIESLFTKLRMRKIENKFDFPIDIVMVEFKELELCCTEITKVSFSRGICPNLQILRIKCCKKFVENGALPTTLIIMDLRCCHALVEIIGLSCVLEKLEELDIRG
eukprot:PITA_22824